MTKILIADEMDLVTHGVCFVLRDYPEWVVVQKCHSLSEVIKQLESATVDIVVCSEQIEPSYDALSLVERLISVAPYTRLILIGSGSNGRLMRDLFTFGLRAYLHQGDYLTDCLPAALRAVLNGSLYLSPTANAEYLFAMQSVAPSVVLNSEDRAVLRLLVQGCTVGAIAAQLKIQPRHVYWICHRLRKRFGAATNTQMITNAVAAGYTSIE